ncbi:MAG: membrane protein insertase YidC [Bacteriovoracaceae bacterium]|jgi:YidC/Oxa1 family membrane protein insertase|nr:membrane protein insertase YidC [Bacteriovoracaceae bacterium]
MQSRDNKNAILAVVLSGLILFGWNYFFGPQPVDVSTSNRENSAKPNQNVETNMSDVSKTDDKVQAKNVNPEKLKPKYKEEKIKLSNANVAVEIDNSLSIVSLTSANSNLSLNDIFDQHFNKVILLDNNKKKEAHFSFNKISDSKVEIVDTEDNLTGSIILKDDNFLEFNLKSEQNFVPSILLSSSEQEMDDGQKYNSFVAYGNDLEIIQVGDEDIEKIESKLEWVGLDFNYHLFGFILDKNLLYKMQTQGNNLQLATIMPVQQFNYQVLLIKKNYDDLISAGNNLSKAVDFGMWEIIAVPILRGLQYFYSLFQNYGIAIIVLTILIRFLTFPLQYKSFKSMKKMQVIQPELKEIKEKYKDNPQKVQQETMALFKKAGANPLGGCLPMLLQMPVFFAFYKVLFTSVELVDAPFYFWISDLSEKDPFYILPVLMGLAMFLNMKLTPSTTMDPAQQKVMMLMPVMFSLFMINLPSGLTLYILISTIVGMLQQLFVYKKTA